MSLNRKDLVSATCMDCGSVVHQGSKRCAPCAAVARGYANRGDKRLAHEGTKTTVWETAR